MEDKELQAFLYALRSWYFSTLGIKVPLTKRLNLDLLVKFCILCFNSIGRTDIKEIVFLDEVANRNMRDNLQCSMNHCDAPYSVMNFLDRKTCKAHVKIGLLYPLYLTLQALIIVGAEYLLIPIKGIERTRRTTSDSLALLFLKYIRKLYGKVKNIYCMTDHNYYSTIACVDSNFYSNVIQHGLWLSDDYGEQVLANRICVWGERSKEAIKTNKLVEITGTYKFDELQNICKNASKASSDHSKKEILLYCISVLNQETVIEKIKIISHIAEKYGLEMKVKTHPGFGFPLDDLQNRFPHIDFYKECVISEIDFTVGICENSTVLLDILCLGKKFIVFDKDNGYFSRYENIIPWASDSKELDSIICNLDEFDFDSVRDELFKYELNNNVCTIF